MISESASRSGTIDRAFSIRKDRADDAYSLSSPSFLDRQGLENDVHYRIEQF